MRKADYALLALLVSELRNANPACAPILETLARRFAQRASVDRAAFLRACGLP